MTRAVFNATTGETVLVPYTPTEVHSDTFVPVGETHVFTKLYKSTFIRRLTASEANDLMQVLNSEEAYIQLLYNSVEWFDVGDALVQYLFMTLEAAYGLERATALLEAEA